MSNHHHHMTRRDFLKFSGVALGGAVLAACQRGSRLVELTAVPSPVSPKPVGQATVSPTQAIPVLAAGESADTILVNGNIVTMDAKRSVAKALAVKNGIILAVGEEQAVRAKAGTGAKTIDLGGRTVTPGLIDAHCHLSACGLLGTAYVDISWPAINTIKQMQAKVTERVAKTPPGEWVLGAGWVVYEGRFPNKHDVDPVSPKHPVMLINQGGHLAVVNSLALPAQRIR